MSYTPQTTLRQIQLAMHNNAAATGVDGVRGRGGEGDMEHLNFWKKHFLF